MASSTAVERPRYLVIDWLRGLAIVCMIAYRTVWDFVTLWETDFSDPWHRALFEPTVAWIPQYIGFTFIFIAGMSFTLGSRHLVKGLQLIAWSTVISLITWFAIPENPVRFGVLNLLGCGMIVLWTLDRVLPERASTLGFVVSLALYAFFFDAQRGTIWGIDLPDALYRNDVTAFFGFPPSDFISSDYYPLIPYVFVMIAGYCTFNVLARANRLAILSVDYTSALGRALRWMGRHSLVIYLLHQPIIFGTLYLLK